MELHKHYEHAKKKAGKKGPVAGSSPKQVKKLKKLYQMIDYLR